MEGFESSPANLRPREKGFATTAITNEIIAAMGLPHRLGENRRHYPFRPYIIEITGNESGSEKYTCNAFLASKNLCDPSRPVQPSDITPSDLREFFGCVYVNLQGSNSGGHSLTDEANDDQKYFFGLLMGDTSESTPRAVFVGNAMFAEACPEELPGAEPQTVSPGYADY